MTSDSKRPLSPHLQVYRLPMTALMSISHRASGAVLVIGAIAFGLWLITAAFAPAYFDMVMGLANTHVGTVVMFGFSFALFYHMCNGIRHLFWDMGFLFKLKNATIANWVVLLSATALTAATWYCACMW